MNTRILDTFVQFKVRFPSFSETLACNFKWDDFLKTFYKGGKKIGCSFDSVTIK